jgi:hypothetical protein
MASVECESRKNRAGPVDRRARPTASETAPLHRRRTLNRLTPVGRGLGRGGKKSKLVIHSVKAGSRHEK